MATSRMPASSSTQRRRKHYARRVPKRKIQERGTDSPAQGGQALEVAVAGVEEGDNDVLALLLLLVLGVVSTGRDGVPGFLREIRAQDLGTTRQRAKGG